EIKDNLIGDELVHQSRDNVLIETLSTGSLGLPIIAGPTYKVKHDNGSIIDILHPGVLLLTKMKRWYHNLESTFPRTMMKTKLDKQDLDYLINWLAKNEMTVELEAYQGKTPDELMPYVRCYWDTIRDDEALVECLRKAMKTKDWNLLMATQIEHVC
ncbi:hypothetical protein BU17DRAFT_35854, partial [Hysterangium stoloniferum]